MERTESLKILYNLNANYDYFCEYFKFQKEDYTSKLVWLTIFKHDKNYLVLLQIDELRNFERVFFLTKHNEVSKHFEDVMELEFEKLYGFINVSSKFFETKNYNRIMFMTKKEKNVNQLKGFCINGVFDVKILPLETKFEKPFYDTFNPYVLPTITPCESNFIEKACL